MPAPRCGNGPRPSIRRGGEGCTARPRTRRPPAPPGRGGPPTSSASCASAATSTWNSTSRTWRSFFYIPGKCSRAYRVIALRKNISRSRGEQVLFDEVRYFFYITTRTDLSIEQVVELANERCDQENVIEQLKNGINALRVPLYDLVSNWPYMVTAALAWNIKSWFAMMMHRPQDRREHIRMELRRFLTSIILIPAMVMRRARAITVRLIGYTRSLDRLLSARNTIERIRFG